MKRKKVLSILMVAAMAASAASVAGCGGGGGDASSNSAVEMRVQRQVGTVSLSNEKGENVTLLEKMRLNAGHNLDTAKESLVTVSMDETRLLTLGENGEASVKQDGNTLRFEVTKGTALVGLTEELKDDQAVEVRSGNMICGIRGTYVEYADDKNLINVPDNKNQIKVPDNKTKTILVLESKKQNGVEVKALDANGNEAEKINVGAGEKVVLKIDNPPASQGQSQSRVGVDLSGSGTQGVLEKSKCNLEDFSATTLNAIPQQGLLGPVSETFGLQEEDVKEFVGLFSQTGTSGGDSNASLPLFGEQAQAMENAAKATKDTTGSEMKTELAVLKGTQDVMNKAVEKGLSDADMASVTKNANDQMNGIAKAAKDAGAQGDGLAEIAKVASGQIVNFANAAIDGGLSVGDINGLTNASAEGFSRIFTSGGTGGLQAASFDSQRALNQINAEVSRQQSSMESLRQLLQERSGDAGARNNEQAMAMLRNGLSGQNAANAGNGTNVQPTPAPTPAPAAEPEPTPTPAPVAEDYDDDDDDDDYIYPSSSQTTPTTYAINKKIRLIYNDEDVTDLQNVKSKLVSINYAGATGDRAVAGSNVTIAVNEKYGVNVIGLQAGQGDNTLYPRLYYDRNLEGLYKEYASGQKEPAEVNSINITMPAGDITATASIKVFDRTVYGWDENTISSVSLPTEEAVSPGDYIEDSSITVNTKPEANATYVHYVTINGDNDATDLRVANDPETHSCQIPIDTSPILHIYTNTD